jgi:fumarate hydratase subunit alpha
MHVRKIEDVVERLCLRANFYLRCDVARVLRASLKKETSPRAKEILKILIENEKIARREKIPLCQDTGMVIVFLEIGQNVILKGGNIEDAVNNGVATAYKRGYLRKSIVRDPLIRVNTGTNSPAIIYTKIVPGSKVRIRVSLRGFGSENASTVRMFKPTATEDEIIKFIVETVKNAGGRACPPVILGIGIGGTMEKAAILSKEATLRPIDRKNPERHLMRLEKNIFDKVNRLGLGPMGLGGKLTCLGVNILAYPTHIAGLPVAVTVACHSLRGAEEIL